MAQAMRGLVGHREQHDVGRPPREGTGENLHQFATAIIVKPLDAPLAGYLAILENLGWRSHRRKSRGVDPPITANAANASLYERADLDVGVLRWWPTFFQLSLAEKARAEFRSSTRQRRAAVIPNHFQQPPSGLIGRPSHHRPPARTIVRYDLGGRTEIPI